MYVFVAFLLIVLINDQSFAIIDSGVKMMAVFLLALVLIIVLAIIPSENQVLKHLVWIAFIAVMAFALAPAIDLAKGQNILPKVLLTVSVMFIAMTYFAYTKPLGYFDSWAPYLFAGLIGVIVAGLSNIIFSDLNSEGFNSRDFIISIVVILLFNGFLLYDTQKIIKEGMVLNTICVGKDNLACADYPEKSMNVILDLMNLFTATTNAYSR